MVSVVFAVRTEDYWLTKGGLPKTLRGGHFEGVPHGELNSPGLIWGVVWRREIFIAFTR